MAMEMTVSIASRNLSRRLCSESRRLVVVVAVAKEAVLLLASPLQTLIPSIQMVAKRVKALLVVNDEVIQTATGERHMPDSVGSFPFFTELDPSFPDCK
mmetsp:Transcript_120434/g.188938  ORF Transcript_120434/g.188938 Transcript_120434/m.188938 type:complete len:99 (+) Transcript_120434:196-492(+)